MTRQQLQYYIEKGKAFGFQLDTGNKETISWISVEKLQFDNRLYSLFINEPESKTFIQQSTIKETPYTIREVEVYSAAIESDAFLLNENYIKNELSYFPSFEELEIRLQSRGIKAEDLKWMADIIHD